ncbi:CDF family Co(II)/Ni(II) efflux transporter DmeF [Roseospirillum parvum]|uniref:Cation diffusion facilitator family transporter n=1 Tax=Roseospirillum parvum TaxID=83401 RepID=A0A1G8E7P2_9PROT|nr:CDF family Co(II)/Ni(II) efflux transporter DmeF [Roseospirillum parvum]SDH65905.1 cation diffusion facilitator family transporter [Roseospirillum parvum]
MHIHSLDTWRHEHVYVDPHQGQAERRVVWVIALTGAAMLLEIGGGWLFNSMALLADGWHMASHAGALGLTVFAYRYARRHRHDARFTFGTGKVGALGGFASAIGLGIVALMMVWESVQRFLEPLAIRFDEAMAVAVLGLLVNLLSAWLLHQGGGHHHHHGHDHGHDHDHVHHHVQESHTGGDQNLRAAFLHVVADALTSVLAIVALLAGKTMGWTWMDPLMGIVGALVIGHWTLGLLRDTGRILLDGSVGETVRDDIRRRIEADADNRVSDLHVWQVGPDHLAVIVSLVTHYPRPAGHYKALLAGRDDLAHVTVEVLACGGAPCLPVAPRGAGGD